MKSLFLIIITSLLWVLGNAQSSSTYRCLLNESTPAAKVLADIEKNYGLSFSYPTKVIKDIEIPSCRIEAKDLESFLEELFRYQQLEYKVVNQSEILIRKELYYTEMPLMRTISLSGEVLDAETQEKLSDVAVYLDTMMIGAITDLQGKFKFEIPANMQERKIIVQMLGYTSFVLPVSSFKEYKPIALKAEMLNLEPVEITEEVPALLPAPSEAALRINTSSLLSSSASNLAGGDLFRSIQMLPGISANDDLDASIKIRGSGGDETLLLLDGIPIYKADHFFGVFSAINSNYVQSSLLYKNALPVEFGGKTGGMLLMESGDQLFQRFSAQMDLNLLSSSLILNTPIGKKMAFQFSGRTTYQDAANNPLFDAFESDLEEIEDKADRGFTRRDQIETVPSFQFYDFNAKWIYQINARNKLDLNFFNSKDDLLNSYENSFSLRNRARRVVTATESFSNAELWKNTGASLNWHSELSDKWRLKSNLYYTKYSNDGNISSSLNRENKDRVVEIWSFENEQYNEIEDLGARVQIEQSRKYERNFSFGAEFIQHQNEFSIIEDGKATNFNGSGDAYEISAFSEYPIINNEQFHVDLGGRLTYYALTDNAYFSPRVNMTYQIEPGIRLKGSFSRAYQFVREVIHENRLGQSLDFFLLSRDEANRDTRFPVGESFNYMVGTNLSLGNFTLDLELYHKDFSGVIEHARLLPGFDADETDPGNEREYRIFTGTGNTTGLDLMLQYRKDDYSAWIAYTLSKSSHQFSGIFQGQAFPSEDDRRHQLSFVNNYRLGKFNLSANYIYSSGRPFNNLAALENGPTDRNDINIDRFIQRLPSYQRLDVGVDYNFSVKWTEVSLGLSVFNVFNRANVKYQQFIYSIEANSMNQSNLPRNHVIGTTTRLLDRTLNLSLGLKF